MILLALGSIVAWLATVALRPVSPDEAWILVVARRVRRGDLLYRDVFFGVGPTPLWLLLAATRLATLQVWVLRLLCALNTAAVSAGLVKIAVVNDVPTWLMAAAVFVETVVCAFSGNDSLYSGFTKACTVGAVAVVLHSSNAVSMAIAGALIGLAVTSKYTIGAIGALGLGGLIATAPGSVGDRFHNGFLAAAAGGLVVAAVLLPIASRGGLRPMWHRLGRDKRSFLQHGTVGVRSGLRERLSIEWHRSHATVPSRRPSRRPSRHPFRTIRRALACIEVSVYATFVIVPFAALSVWVAVDDTRSRWLVTALALLWVGLVLPRADFSHSLGGLAVAALTTATAISALGHEHTIAASTARLGHGLIASWIALLGVARLGVRLFAAPRRPERHAPHCRLVPFEAFDIHDADTVAHRIRDAGGEKTFLLGADAPIMWLISDLRNATPFDYPFASTFGVTGQSDVAGLLHAGVLPAIAFVGTLEGPNQPELVRLAADHRYRATYSVGTLSVLTATRNGTP